MSQPAHAATRTYRQSRPSACGAPETGNRREERVEGGGDIDARQRVGSIGPPEGGELHHADGVTRVRAGRAWSGLGTPAELVLQRARLVQMRILNGAALTAPPQDIRQHLGEREDSL